jgi:hypothetical protein
VRLEYLLSREFILGYLLIDNRYSLFYVDFMFLLLDTQTFEYGLSPVAKDSFSPVAQLVRALH